MKTRSWPGGALIALALLVPAAARAELLDARPGGMTLSNSAVVPVDAAAAWSALVRDVDRWWPKDHSWWGAEGVFSIEARANGCFCERAGVREALHMTVSFVDPPRLLRMVGGLGPLQGMGLSGALEWRFVPAEGGGTRITLHYVAGGYTTEDIQKFAPVVDQVQGIQLGALAAYLSGKGAPAGK